MNYQDAVREVERASIALRSVEERLESVNRQIEIQIEAFALVPKDFDDNKTIMYYVSERNRVTKKLETESSSIESQLLTLDAKKNAAIDATEQEFNNKVSSLEERKAAAIRAIESEYTVKMSTLEGKKDTTIKAIELDYNTRINSLEAKKEQMTAKLNVETERYSKEIERVQASLENPEPQTPLFRKLKADKVKLEKEKVDAEIVFSDKLSLRRQAEQKRQENIQREYEEKQRVMVREQYIKDEEARQRIEQYRENERKREQERAEQRCKEAKAAVWPVQQPTEVSAPSPLKKGKMVRPKGVAPMMPLDITKKYRYDDLMAIVIDYDTVTEYEEEVYDKACAYAARREKINGWASLRHNLTADGDLISEEEFANICK